MSAVFISAFSFQRSTPSGTTTLYSGKCGLSTSNLVTLERRLLQTETVQIVAKTSLTLVLPHPVHVTLETPGGVVAFPSQKISGVVTLPFPVTATIANIDGSSFVDKGVDIKAFST